VAIKESVALNITEKEIDELKVESELMMYLLLYSSFSICCFYVHLNKYFQYELLTFFKKIET